MNTPETLAFAQSKAKEAHTQADFWDGLVMALQAGQFADDATAIKSAQDDADTQRNQVATISAQLDDVKSQLAKSTTDNGEAKPAQPVVEEDVAETPES